MRVCHPGPVAFHPAITSGGRRSESSCLRLTVGGRPRRTSFVPRRKSAPTTHSFVISGASSRGAVSTERFRFALMTVPHANDSPGITPAVIAAAIRPPSRGTRVRRLKCVFSQRAHHLRSNPNYAPIKGTTGLEMNISISGAWFPLCIRPNDSERSNNGNHAMPTATNQHLRKHAPITKPQAK
jgi:hypothetical protein